MNLNYSNFCLDTFIHELILDFEFLAINDKKKLEARGEESKIYVSADKDKLEKVFNNLLNNAFKYTRTNDSIKIIYQRKGKELLVEVCDTGRGIDRVDLPHIFERFFQSRRKQSDYIGGSGIGLAFSKRLVEMHYGNISAESELGKGTTISVRLPIVIDIDDNIREKEDEVLAAGKVQLSESREDVPVKDIKVDGAFSDSRIFFVEDNSDMRMFVSDMLANFFKVKTFMNGRECLDAMEKEWPDLVVSDVLMPELNGFELCQS